MSSCEIIRMPRAQRQVRVLSEGDGRAFRAHRETAPEAMVSFAAANEEALRRAFEQGIEEGQRRTSELLGAQYTERVEEQCRRIDALYAAVQEALSSQSAETERALTAFAVGVAEQIVRREVALDRDIVLAIMKEGIRKIVGVEKLTVRVHPDDLTYVQEQRRTVQAVSDSLREIVFEADPGVEPGGCTIESDIGNVDARIATQLDQVRSFIESH